MTVTVVHDFQQVVAVRRRQFLQVRTIRNECLDHRLLLGHHLQRTVDEFVAYYNSTRTHLSFDRDTPEGRPEVRVFSPRPFVFWSYVSAWATLSVFKQMEQT